MTPSICTVGSINMDMVFRLASMPRGGENVFCRDIRHSCGGKGENQAVALHLLGADVRYCGCVGRDTYGDQLISNLKKIGLNTAYIQRRDTDTGVAYIFVEDDGENRIIVHPGANEALTPEDMRQVVRPLIAGSELVLIQLEIAEDCIEEIIKICRELDKRLIVDAGPVRGVTARQLAGVYCVSPNETELAALTGEITETREQAIAAAKKLLDLGVEHVVLKRGGEGSIYVSRERTAVFPAYRVKAVDTTGAGDSFMAGFAVSLAKGRSMDEAIQYGNKCGAVAVTRPGAVASMPSAQDIAQFDSFLS